MNWTTQDITYTGVLAGAKSWVSDEGHLVCYGPQNCSWQQFIDHEDVPQSLIDHINHERLLACRRVYRVVIRYAAEADYYADCTTMGDAQAFQDLVNGGLVARGKDAEFQTVHIEYLRLHEGCCVFHGTIGEEDDGWDSDLGWFAPDTGANVSVDKKGGAA